MIKIEETETYGWEAAIRGMRNPMNSWDKSDSYPQLIAENVEKSKGKVAAKKKIVIAQVSKNM